MSIPLNAHAILLPRVTTGESMAVQMWRMNLLSTDFLGLSRVKVIRESVWALFTYVLGFVALFAPDQP